MSATSNGSDSNPIGRVIAVIGSLAFVALALYVAAKAFEARSARVMMSNWKNGGKMTYQEGFGLAGVFLLFAGIWFYGALRPKSVVDSFNRSRKERDEKPSA